MQDRNRQITTNAHSVVTFPRPDGDKEQRVDAMARRLDWAPGDATSEWVRGELVIGDPGEASEYAVHLVAGYPVDPETLVAVTEFSQIEL